MPEPGPPAGGAGRDDRDDRDDWDAHWARYADTAADNPAQAYRRRLIEARIEQAAPGGAAAGPGRIVDIGSGQGDLLADLRRRWPDAELLGLELSAEGVEVARGKVPDARLVQVDLLAGPAPGVDDWAEVGVCSEVLEHVDEPEVLLANGARAVAPGGRVVITVPGGPRTAFDRHIGHRRHHDRASLTAVIRAAGLEAEVVTGNGRPFFDLYKLLVLARGQRVVDDVAAGAPPSRLATAAMACFGAVLRPSLCSSRWGWQLVAVARRP